MMVGLTHFPYAGYLLRVTRSNTIGGYNEATRYII